jgi:transposase
MQKKYIHLTPQEALTLEQCRKHHPSFQVRDRSHCLLLSQQGMDVQELAGIFAVAPLTIYTWFYRWQAKGLVGLFNGKGRGRKAILSAADQPLIKEKVQANAQKLSLARDELKAQLQKDFSQRTLQRFLKSLVSAGEDGASA